VGTQVPADGERRAAQWRAGAKSALLSAPLATPGQISSSFQLESS
jgi:hypothetical protein